MSSHRQSPSRARRRTSGRARALMSLGAVGFLAIGLGAQGTFAFWSDTATAATGEFNSGTLDITLDGALVGPGTTNNPGTYTAPISMANMVPGESVAYSFPVKNNGSTPLTYTLTATGSGPLAVTNGMQYSVTFGVNGTTTGSQATNDRKGQCGATVSTDQNTAVLNATPSGFGGTNRALAPGVSETVCIVARFSSAADNTLQNKTGTTASFVFAAKQVGAP